MSIAARSTPASQPPVQPRLPEPATFDAGGPVAALQEQIAAQLAGAVASTPADFAQFDPTADGWIERASRAAGPIVLLLAYVSVAVLLVR